MIILDNVSKRYPNGTLAVDGVNLRIPAGSVLVLAGRSGAGKSTLLKLIYGEEKPTSGRVLVDGRDLSKLSSRQLAAYQREIGMAHQRPRLRPRKRVGEAVAMPLRTAGVGPRERKRRAYQMLRDLGLAHRSTARPRELSDGEQQRVALARAMIMERKIVLADEPTGNLDSDMTRHILRMLIEANRAGATVVIASHQWDIIETLCNRTLILDAGNVIFEPAWPQELDEDAVQEGEATSRGEPWNPYALGRSVVRFLEEMRRRQEEGTLATASRCIADDLPDPPPRERAAPRVDLREVATLAVNGQRIHCLTRNISSIGIAMNGVSSELPDRRIRVSFSLPGVSEVLETDAILVRQAERGAVREWGARFHNADPRAIATIAEFVARQVSERSEGAYAVTRTRTLQLDEILSPLYKAALRAGDT